MSNQQDTDQWIHLLRDADLTPDQRKKLEALLAGNPQAVRFLRQTEKLNRLLQEISRETPSFNKPDFVWSRVKHLIEEDEDHASSWLARLQKYFPLPRWGALVVGCFALALGLTFWLKYSAPSKPSHFGNFSVYSYKPEISATTYNSSSADATIIWLSDTEEYDSKFGEIWEVYSFKPEVWATAYNSQSGNATIIWISGMDDDDPSSEETSS